MALYLKDSSITPPVSIDWNGKPLEMKFNFILEISNEAIAVGGRFPRSTFALGEKNQFVEGLWAGTLVELFVHDSKGNRYVEFNLSATGAYWIAEFSEYRKRASEIKLPVTIEVKELDDQVEAVLKIQKKNIPLLEFTVAQTAILDPGSIQPHDRIFVVRKFGWKSSAKSELNMEPDFHQKKLAESF